MNRINAQRLIKAHTSLQIEESRLTLQQGHYRNTPVPKKFSSASERLTGSTLSELVHAVSSQDHRCPEH